MKPRRVECDEVGSDPRRCAAAHRLHQVHVSWARDAIDSRSEYCYQCHVFTSVVTAALDTYDRETDP